jgi:AcrR family transcriptional regulator
VTPATEDEVQPSGRALRADARRNVQRILEAAQDVFASEGLSVPVDVIASRAGVGVGTLYRHFPTKEALFRAVVKAHLQDLAARAQQLSCCPQAGPALFTFIRELVEMSAHKRDLADELARAGIDSTEVSSVVRAELEGAFGQLLARAQASGDVRGDVSFDDVTCLIMGACMAAELRGKPVPTGHLAAIICDGLRPGGAQGHLS